MAESDDDIERIEESVDPGHPGPSPDSNVQFFMTTGKGESGPQSTPGASHYALLTAYEGLKSRHQLLENRHRKTLLKLKQCQDDNNMTGSGLINGHRQACVESTGERTLEERIKYLTEMLDRAKVEVRVLKNQLSKSQEDAKVANEHTTALAAQLKSMQIQNRTLWDERNQKTTSNQTSPDNRGKINALETEIATLRGKFALLSEGQFPVKMTQSAEVLIQTDGSLSSCSSDGLIEANVVNELLEARREISSLKKVLEAQYQQIQKLLVQQQRKQPRTNKIDTRLKPSTSQTKQDTHHRLPLRSRTSTGGSSQDNFRTEHELLVQENIPKLGSSSVVMESGQEAVRSDLHIGRVPVEHGVLETENRYRPHSHVQRPINIERNDHLTVPPVRSYDNNNQNVNIDVPRNPPTASYQTEYLNNDPLIGHKVLPSRNLYTEHRRYHDPHHRPSNLPTIYHDGPRLNDLESNLNGSVREEAPQECPVCSTTFPIAMAMEDIQRHVLECSPYVGTSSESSTARRDSDDHVCPVCNISFPRSLSQEEFTRHVNDHFDDEDIGHQFEVL